MGTRQLVSLAAAAGLLLCISACAPMAKPVATLSAAEAIAHAHDDLDDPRRVFTQQGVGSVEFTVTPEQLEAALTDTEITEAIFALNISCTGDESVVNSIDQRPWGSASCGYGYSNVLSDGGGQTVAGPTGGGIKIWNEDLLSLDESHNVKVVGGKDSHILVTLSVMTADEQG